jgi:hypothetical protein
MAMQLSSACTNILHQLSEIIRQLDEKDFARPSATLGQSTIGQHIRHTLEFFLCLEKGFPAGTVNYDRRAHDKLIESDKFIALNSVNRIIDFVTRQKSDQPMKLEVGYQPDSDECLTIDTNYYRELSYNIEHAVHHMAIIKIGLRELAPYVQFPPDFGIAISTVRYQASLAASH